MRREISLRSVSGVTAASLLLMLVQFVFQMLLAAAFGDQPPMDAYVAAIAWPTVVTAVLSGAVAYAFVPAFIRCHEQGRENEARQLVSVFAIGLNLCLALLTLGTFLGAGALMDTLAPGLDAERRAIAVRLTRLGAALIWLNTLATFFQSLHQSRGWFRVPALAQLAAAAVSSGWFWGQLRLAGGAPSIEQALLALLIGSGINVILQGAYLADLWTLPRGSVAPAWQVLGSMSPLLLAGLYSQLEPLVDRYLASEMPPGSLAHLGYANRVMNACLMLTSAGLSSVVFPVLAAHASAGRKAEFQAAIGRGLRLVFLLLGPLAVGIALFAGPVVRDLFQRGSFGPQDTVAVARLWQMYIGLLIGAGLGDILAKTFYSLGDTRTPVIIGAVAFTVGLLVKLALAGAWGVQALPLGSSVYALLSFTGQAYVLRRRVGSYLPPDWPALLVRVGLATAIACAMGYLVLRAEFFLSAVVAACVGLATFATTLAVLGETEARRLWLGLRLAVLREGDR